MKNIYQRLLLVLLFVAGTFSNYVYAEHLTPEEALSRVESASPRKAIAAKGGSRLTLAFTQYGLQSDLAMVYVFNQADDKDGFLVLAADDEVGDIILGYSTDTKFDPNNIPAAMRWLLDAYSVYVSNAATAPKKLSLDAGPKKAARSARTDIAPLVATRWSQSAPYYNNCPLVNGSRCVTGCVATAMAQIMKYHEWPTQGVGSYTHTFEYGGSQYTTTANFGATTYDWTNMTNTYSNKSTAAQNAAVATLMHHCGVASRMDYSPSSSGTSDLFAGNGMIKYFKYDKAMRNLQRCWFTTDEWDELVYSQLENDLPVMYSGLTANYEGHEFVCDGYRASDGLFHINWGWGGSADGYFMLSGLDPSSQGIGGSSDGAGFNMHQSILCDIKPDEGSSLVATLFLNENLVTDKSEYERKSGVRVVLKGGVYSSSLDDVTVEVGIQFLGSISGVASLGTVDLQPMYGFGEVPLNADGLPVGEYDIRYVYRADGSTTWQPVYHDKSIGNGCVHFVVTETSVTSSTSVVEEPVSVEGFLERITPVDMTDIATKFTGHEYDFVYSVKADDEWKGQMACVLFNDDDQIVAVSELQNVTIKDSEELTFRVEMPEEAGVYNYTLVYVDGEYLSLCAPSAKIKVVEALSDGAFALTAYILNVDRGYLPFGLTGGAVKATTEAIAGRYALLQVPSVTRDATEQYYLYCVDNSKFIKSADFDGTNGFIDEPDGTFTMTPIGSTGKFILASESKGHYLQFGGSSQLLVNGWTTLDAGNQWTITEVGPYDATEVYSKLGWDITTGIDAAAPAAGTQTIYNLNGQAVTNAKRGLYIINGKKMVVK